MDDEQKSPSKAPVETKEINPVSVAPDDNATESSKNDHDGVCCGDENSGGLRFPRTKEEISTDQGESLSNSIQSMDLAGNISADKGLFPLFVLFLCF